MPTLFLNHLLITGSSNASVAEVRRLLVEKFADLGDVSKILGMGVQRDKAAGTNKLSR